MFGISSVRENKLENIKLEERLNELETKINHLFKKIVASMIAAGTMISVVVIQGVTLPLLATITTASAGYPFYSTLVKSSLIFGGVFGIFSFVLVWVVLLKCYKIIMSDGISN